MTRDKEYISKYLEDNYVLVANYDFEYMVKGDKLGFAIQEKQLKNEILLVFGNFVGLGNIFDEWSQYHKKILAKRLYDYFDSLDFSLGSKHLMDEMNKTDMFKDLYRFSFVEKEFEKYYISKQYGYLVNEISSKSENQSSSNLLTLVLKDSNKETKSMIEKIELMVNEWYYDNIFKSRLDEFFSKCWLSLGETNWVVKHPLYGTFDEKSLIVIFNNETPFQKSILRKRFNQWYEENIYEASEMAVKNLYL